jgi:hypothetical protein
VKHKTNGKFLVAMFDFDYAIAFLRKHEGNKVANETTKQLSRDYEGL